MRWERRAFTEAVGRFGFYYFVGAIYFVFGRNQLLVQFLNGTIGALTVVVMHALATRLFGALVARRVAILMAFFPGMVFWSAGMYKDPAILLCIAVSMYAVVRLREAVSPAMLMLFVGAVLALVTLRFYIAYFVVFATLSSFVFSRRGSLLQRIFSYGLLVGALAAVFTFAVRQEALEEQSTYMTLERLQVTRSDQAILGQSAFGREYDVSTPGGAVLALPVGLTYLLFAPFPWAIAGTRQALVLPEMLVWYGLMPAFVAGLRSCHPAAAWRRPAHPGVRGDPDAGLCPDAGQHRHRLPPADAGDDVLLPVHGRGAGREGEAEGARQGAVRDEARGAAMTRSRDAAHGIDRRGCVARMNHAQRGGASDRGRGLRPARVDGGRCSRAVVTPGRTTRSVPATCSRWS